MSGNPGHAPVILIVDDDPGARLAVRAFLAPHGYSIMDAADAEGALAVLGSWKGTVDLLITDFVMPGMNGHELARRARALRPSLRVLYISGYIDEPPVQAGVMEGVFKDGAQFLQKPFSPDMLVRRVRSVLAGL